MTIEERIYTHFEAARLISVQVVERPGTICDICRGRVDQVISCRCTVAHESITQEFYLICEDGDACEWRLAVRT